MHVAFFWRKGVQNKTGLDRVCAISLELENGTLLLVIICFMTHSGHMCINSIEAYEEQLGCIESINQDDRFSSAVLIGELMGIHARAQKVVLAVRFWIC